jgi:hypothetical protein
MDDEVQQLADFGLELVLCHRKAPLEVLFNRGLFTL